MRETVREPERERDCGRQGKSERQTERDTHTHTQGWRERGQGARG